jgi:hypothetical protein
MPGRQLRGCRPSRFSGGRPAPAYGSRMTISLLVLIVGIILLALPPRFQTATGHAVGMAALWLGLAYTLAAVGHVSLFHVS